VLKLGSDIQNGYAFQEMVPAGCWFASAPVTEDGFSFVGCTVAPGFDFADFVLAGKENLLNEYPQHAAWINKLCGK
jgi:predicted cupin superfamily sugar epimerase